MTKVAIVGTGFWGAKLAEAAGRSSLELVACYSRNAEKRARYNPPKPRTRLSIQNPQSKVQNSP